MSYCKHTVVNSRLSKEELCHVLKLNDIVVNNYYYVADVSQEQETTTVFLFPGRNKPLQFVSSAPPDIVVQLTPINKECQVDIYFFHWKGLRNFFRYSIASLLGVILTFICMLSIFYQPTVSWDLIVVWDGIFILIVNLFRSFLLLYMYIVSKKGIAKVEKQLLELLTPP